MAKIFTPQVFTEISNLVSQGFSAAEIADKIGCKLNSLRVKCSQQGICLRRQSKLAHEGGSQERLTIKLSGATAVRLLQQAGKQGVSGTRFAAALLEAIVRDNLYDAVIDQEVGSPRLPKDIRQGSGRTHRTSAGPRALARSIRETVPTADVGLATDAHHRPAFSPASGSDLLRPRWRNRSGDRA